MIRLRKPPPDTVAAAGGRAATTRSTRSVRLQAHAPRIAFYLVIAVMVAAGVRATFGESAAPAAAAPEVHGPDQGAQTFAEAFARTFLTWDADDADTRDADLAAFLPGDGDAGDAGFRPPDGDSQTVEWTAVAGAERAGARTLVTVAARTSAGRTYLSVPVARDRRGFLYVAGHPAVVGPPVTAEEQPIDTAPDVADAPLEAVVERALTNYLARAESNLLADLTPDAVVSLPVAPLELTGVDDITWLRVGSRVAAEVRARDEQGGTWSLRYELEVRKRDRWVVQSLQVDPTFEGGSS